MNGSVYFIQAGESGPIKIGLADNVGRRFSALRVNCPLPLSLLGTVEGGRAKELELHRKFSDVRTQGEWFSPNSALLDWIKVNAVPPSRQPKARQYTRKSFPAGTEFSSTAEVIEALGGYRAAAQITGRKDSAAWNWHKFATFPSNTYVAMQEMLAEYGYSAPPSLWGMIVTSGVAP